MSAEDDHVTAGDSDDDFDWEEVDVTQQPVTLDVPLDQEDQAGPSDATRPNIEITIQARPKPDEAAKKRAIEIQAQRAMRLDCHKMHTICLIGNARIRNKWINDELLHARLMSLTPIALQNAFVITKVKVPEAPMRGRMFESAVTGLVEWWQAIFEVETTGHICNRTFEEVKQQLSAARKGKGRAVDSDDEDDEDEIIRSEKSLMKHALMKRGSRDTSAQLFTALCRALGIPSRLVVSLQSVPWQAGVGKPRPDYKKKSKGMGKEKATEEVVEDDEDMEMEEVSIPGSPVPTLNGKGKGKASFPGTGQSLSESGSSTPLSISKGKQKAPPVIGLRKSKGQKLGSATSELLVRKPQPADPRVTPPVFWTEVFSRADGRWLSVDPIRGIVNKRKLFDPEEFYKSARALNVKVENRMVYVVAFEEDGYARDVTPRYAKEFGAKVSKMQQGGKGRKQWWEMIMGTVTRPYRLNRDDLEDEELHNHQLTEQMPTSMAGFKDHPLYALVRHLKRDEVIHPLTELGKFRGEPVYARSSVITLKTPENWMRQGRKVREGCQPMKLVKQRAVTVNKKRAIELAMADRAGDDGGDGLGGEKDVMQGLYAHNQTELYKADPVVDGVVPKNDFGNIDLYVPSMLPAGGAYIPHKGAAKIARQLGFDHAEAVTSFEFKKRYAFPVITGIVVAAENEETVLEAYWAAEHEAEQKRHAKRQEQVIKRWTRLIKGLSIRQRLQEQYADRIEQQSGDVTPAIEDVPVQGAGGFLVGADDVVQPYFLPRDLHDRPKTPPAEINGDTSRPGQGPRTPKEDIVSIEVIEDSQEEDPDMVEEVIPLAAVAAPKTMRELAEDAERLRKESRDVSPAVGSSQSADVTPSPAVQINGRANGRTTRSGTGTPAMATSSRKGKGASTSQTVKPRNGRSQKRARHDLSDSDLEGSIKEVKNEAQPTPPKRARPILTPVIKSDRVLRTRAGKSEDRIRQEKEMEAAYRIAIAE